ncbi:putative inactive receptor kinase, partial [Cucurbita argyrosperma subsp. sororia]
MARRLSLPAFSVFLILFSLLNDSVLCKTLKRDVKALNEIKASLGWRVVYSWVGDDPCGDGDLPAWSGVTCSTQGDYREVTKLEVYEVSIVGPFPTAVTNLLDLTGLFLDYNQFSGRIPDDFYKHPLLKEMFIEGNAFRQQVKPISIHKALEVSDAEFLV